MVLCEVALVVVTVQYGHILPRHRLALAVLMLGLFLCGTLECYQLILHELYVEVRYLIATNGQQWDFQFPGDELK